MTYGSLLRYGLRFNLFIASLVIFILTGCSGSSTGQFSTTDGSAGQALPTDLSKLLSLTPMTKVVPMGGSATITVTGGQEPYRFDIYLGAGNIEASGSTGTYLAPTSESNAVIRVQDADGNMGYATIEVTDAPLIQPSNKILAVNNSFPFAVLGGKLPYVFSIISGEGSITTSGLYTAGVTTGSAVVRVRDSAGAIADANITINPALILSGKKSSVEKDSTFSFSATGGVPPYTYSISSGDGSINASSGVYTAPSAPGSVAVQVRDSFGNIDSSALTITNSLKISPVAALPHTLIKLSLAMDLLILQTELIQLQPHCQTLPPKVLQEKSLPYHLLPTMLQCV